MRGILTIAGRDLAAAFGRPQAYVVLGVFIALLSLLTLGLDDVLRSGVASMRGPFYWMSACLLFLVPATTMGSLAEERGSGRLELLESLPWRTSALVIGKWLAAVAMVVAALALTAPWPLLLVYYGSLDPGPVAGGYLGLLLGGASLAAVGTAASALADRQVSAFVLALEAGLVPWLLGFALPLLPADWVAWVGWLTFEHHFENLARGVLDTRSLVFFGSVTALFLRVATHLLERRRLR